MVITLGLLLSITAYYNYIYFLCRMKNTIAIIIISSAVTGTIKSKVHSHNIKLFRKEKRRKNCIVFCVTLSIIFMKHLNIAVVTILEVRHNGEPTSGSEFCNGDNLILTCNISNTVTYVWTVSGLVMGNDGTASVNLGASTREVNGTTFTLVATSNGPSSMSTLSFTVSDLLNERNITCGASGQAPTESQVINVLGMSFQQV